MYVEDKPLTHKTFHINVWKNNTSKGKRISSKYLYVSTMNIIKTCGPFHQKKAASVFFLQ